MKDTALTMAKRLIMDSIWKSLIELLVTCCSVKEVTYGF